MFTKSVIYLEEKKENMRIKIILLQINLYFCSFYIIKIEISPYPFSKISRDGIIRETIKIKNFPQRQFFVTNNCDENWLFLSKILEKKSFNF